MIEQVEKPTPMRLKKEIKDRETFEKYERFHIKTEFAASRRKVPNPFYPRVKKIGLAKYLIKEILHYNIKLAKKEYRGALLSRPCIYGVFSGRFGGFKPQRELCTGCMRCVLEFPEFCRVDRNPEFRTLGDSYWLPEDPTRFSFSAVAIVNYEAETGKIPIKGMGYKGPFAGKGWDSIWTDMSEIVRPTRDGVHGREYISTLVDIGYKPKFISFENGQPSIKSRTVQATVPILFDYLPPNLNNDSIRKSIHSAAKKIGTFYIERPSNINFSEKKEFSTLYKNMIPLLTTRDRANLTTILEHAEIVSYSIEEHNELYSQIRSVNPNIPIIVRIPFKRGIATKLKTLLNDEIDGFHLFADYHGKEYNTTKNPSFIKDLLLETHKDLVDEGLRDEITIIASGGIILAEHVPKAIICGADVVAIDTAILVALQCRFDGPCRSPEEGKIKSDRFSPQWGAQRLTNLIASWHAQLIEILSAMGMRDVRRLRGDVGRAMFNEELEKEAFGEIEVRTGA